MLSKLSQDRPWKHLSFITLQILLVSISNGCQLKEYVMVFIDNPGFPGGPIAWFNLSSNYLKTPAGIGEVIGFISFWLQDGFLVSNLWLFWVLITIFFLDVPLLHYLWIQSVLSYSSRYSILDVCSWAVVLPPKSGYQIDSEIFSFFYFRYNWEFHVLNVYLELYRSHSLWHRLLCSMCQRGQQLHLRNHFRTPQVGLLAVPSAMAVQPCAWSLRKFPCIDILFAISLGLTRPCRVREWGPALQSPVLVAPVWTGRVEGVRIGTKPGWGSVSISMPSPT